MTKEELKQVKDRVVELLKSTGIYDMDYFFGELERSGYFTAPASMKNHLCFEGGLMCHSLNVCEAALKLKKMMMADRPDVLKRSAMRVSLLLRCSMICARAIFISSGVELRPDSARLNMGRHRDRCRWVMARNP